MLRLRSAWSAPEKRGAFDRFESEKISFFEHVRRAYLLQAELYPERIKLIKANQPLVDVQRATD